MQIRIFMYDVADLYWVDGAERSGLELEFSSVLDAVWAMCVWENFINGTPGEPVLRETEHGIEIIHQRYP